MIGVKSREVYECPGSVTLIAANKALERLVLTRDELRFKATVDQKYAELVYYGYWFAPERDMLQTAIDESQKNVTGTARVKLYKGLCSVVGRKSPYSLYREDIATFEKDSVYQQADATGFIRLNSLRLRVQSMAKRKFNG